MVLGPALALDAVSTTYAVVVLLALAFELREERPPSARRSQRWAWIFLAVNIFVRVLHTPLNLIKYLLNGIRLSVSCSHLLQHPIGAIFSSCTSSTSPASRLR